jgi:hypothetical protein
MIYIIEMSLNGSDWTPLTGGEIYLTEKGCREKFAKDYKTPVCKEILL